MKGKRLVVCGEESVDVSLVGLPERHALICRCPKTVNFREIS